MECSRAAVDGWQAHSGEVGVPLNFKIAGGLAISATLAEFPRHASSDPANVHGVPLAAVRTDALHLRLVKNNLRILPHILRPFLGRDKILRVF